MAASVASLREGQLRLTFVEHPDLDLALGGDYHATDSFFVTVDAEDEDGTSVLIVTIHPKVEGLRLRSVLVGWTQLRTAEPFAGTRSYRYAKVRGLLGEPLSLWSVDEATAFTHFSADGHRLLAERVYSNKALRHSLPLLHFELRPLAQVTLPEPGHSPTPQHVLRLDGGFLNLWPELQDELLSASLLPDLGIATLWLDLPLSLGFQTRLGPAMNRLAAFAKTCRGLGFRPGISLAPFVWTAAGTSPHVGARPSSDTGNTPEYVDSAGRWSSTLGRKAHTVAVWDTAAETSLTQGLLSLQDLGFDHFDLQSLGTLGHPDRVIHADEPELLHRGLSLLAEAVPSARLIASDLPVVYLEGRTVGVRDNISNSQVDAESGFWRKPLLPGLAPRYEVREWSRAPALWALGDAESLPDRKVSRNWRSRIYELPTPAIRDYVTRASAPPNLTLAYWRRVEVAVQRQLAAWSGERHD